MLEETMTLIWLHAGLAQKCLSFLLGRGRGGRLISFWAFRVGAFSNKCVMRRVREFKCQPKPRILLCWPCLQDSRKRDIARREGRILARAKESAVEKRDWC